MVDIVERGQVSNRARNLQCCDMSGLRFGQITPTDVDAAIEFDNRLFIFIEAKFIATPIKYGQELFLSRMADNMHKPPGVFAVSIIADHCAPADTDIDYASMIVRSWRWYGSWRSPLNKNTTVLQAIRRVGAYVENIQGRPLYKRMK